MIRHITQKEINLFLNDDPVRKHIKQDQRIGPGKSILVLEEDDSVKAIVCTCLCNSIPTNEYEMFNDYFDEHGDILVAYTIWSYSRGSGRKLINQLREKAILENIRRVVTLSPLTEMAEKFHIKNGASLLGKYNSCQNFEYPL